MKPEIKALYDEQIMKEITKNFGDKIEELQENISPEFAKIINKNFDELIK